MVLHERIRNIRMSKGLTQVELANLLNVTKQSVSNWENDNIQPSVDMLVKIAGVLSVSTDHLLGLDDKQYLQVDGLTPEQLAHVQQIVNDIRHI